MYAPLSGIMGGKQRWYGEWHPVICGSQRLCSVVLLKEMVFKAEGWRRNILSVA